VAIFIPLVTKFDPKGLQGAQRALANFQNFAVDVGRVAAAAVAAVAVASVKEAAQFETSLSKIQGLVGVSSDEIDILAESARRLGPAFGSSANDAADALFFITSAGLRGADATNILEAALKGSAIGLGETKTIADLATSAVNAYGASQLDGAKAVDVLAEAVRLGKLEPAELAASMGDVLPLASALGVRFDEVGAAMAGMSKTGTDAATASTQLRGIFNALVKPTSEANRALESMGLSAQGLREQVREKGLLSVLQTLTKEFDGNLEATADVFGNVRALTGVLDLMGSSAAENAEVFRLMADDTGVLDEALAITAETAQFKFNVAMGKTRDTLIGIGQSVLVNLMPHLDKFLAWIDLHGKDIENVFIGIFNGIDDFVGSDALADMGQAFSDMWPDIREMAVATGELSAALAPLVGGTLKNVTDLLTPLVSITANLSWFLGKATGGLGDFEDEASNFPSVVDYIIDPLGSIIGAFEKLDEVIQIARDAFNRFLLLGGVKNLNLGGLANTGGLGTAAALALAGPQTDPTGPGSGRAGETPGQRPTTNTNLFNSFQARRASGGPVTAGSSYLVGEMGPEVFTPGNSGDIIANDKLGGNVYNITVNAGMGSGSGSELGEKIVTAIKRYERSSGPVFQGA
jgi:TP901 family phage tail tape measure protein